MPKTNLQTKVKKPRKKRHKKEDNINDNRNSVKDSVENNVENSVKDSINNSVENSVENSVNNSVEDSVNKISQEHTQKDIPVKQRKKRMVPTRDSVLEEFDKLLDSLTTKITKLRESQEKIGIRFLRGVYKKLRLIRSHTMSITKRKYNRKSNNKNSGFLKPKNIRDDFVAFAGWNPDEKYSRNDVTKFLCNYIAENNLQDKKDKRIILLKNDNKLANLLQYNQAEYDNMPLNYCRLQKCLGKFFIEEKKEK